MAINDGIDAGKILGLVQGFMESRILLSAAELNIFTLLETGPMTAPEIAHRIGGDLRGVAALLDAVAAMGLLEKEGGRYRNDSSITRLLSESSPESVLPMVLHMASLWTRWSHLTEIARRGDEARQEFHFTRNPDELRAFIGAMHAIGAPLARKIVSAVRPGEAKALLDIGGGSGTYTIAFLNAAPQMKATLFDLPEVIEMARERLESEGLLDRVRLVSGNYNEDELPGGHDLVLLSAIIHSNSLDENRELYRKAFRALNPGGRILIRDHVMDPERIRPGSGAIFAVNMLVGTSGGGSYTYEEIADGLSGAGFDKTRLLVQGDNMDAVVEAFKP